MSSLTVDLAKRGREVTDPVLPCGDGNDHSDGLNGRPTAPLHRRDGVCVDREQGVGEAEKTLGPRRDGHAGEAVALRVRRNGSRT